MESYSLASEFCKVLGLLGLLIVFALFAVGLRKRRFMPGGSRLHLQIIDSLPLGKDRAICIVKAGQSHFLLGLTDHQISVLKEITNDELDSVSERQILDDPPTAGNCDFFSGFMAKVSQRARQFKGKNMLIGLILGALLAGCAQSYAFAAPTGIIPSIDLKIDGDSGQGGLLNAIGILAVLTVLTLAPAILILTTSFTRTVIVFSFLRAGLGTQQTPPNQVLIGLALLLTFFIMAPTWGQVNEVAITPYTSGDISAQEAILRGQEPLKEFMLKQTREKDLALFIEIGQSETPSSPEEVSFVQIVPAFAISELKTAFEMGFILFLPFLVIDMVVASTLMSMGMLMLPPVLISLPFKLLLFVLVDGWSLVTRSLIGSFR
ncbi:MAG TPA: flagellar type III secretion system pore protein FliP [Firmicutes bacterium]|nr:flagellar type III secretion system pore protein FliP [Bacillota bacterium]